MKLFKSKWFIIGGTTIIIAFIVFMIMRKPDKNEQIADPVKMFQKKIKTSDTSNADTLLFFAIELIKYTNKMCNNINNNLDSYEERELELDEYGPEYGYYKDGVLKYYPTGNYSDEGTYSRTNSYYLDSVLSYHFNVYRRQDGVNTCKSYHEYTIDQRNLKIHQILYKDKLLFKLIDKRYTENRRMNSYYLVIYDNLNNYMNTTVFHKHSGSKATNKILGLYEWKFTTDTLTDINNNILPDTCFTHNHFRIEKDTLIPDYYTDGYVNITSNYGKYGKIGIFKKVSISFIKNEFTDKPEIKNEVNYDSISYYLKKNNYLLSLGLHVDKPDLPNEIFDHPELMELNLRCCNLKEIPAEIRKLKNLVSLNLMDNRLSAFPFEITSLTNLVDLNLNNNNITDIPKEIGNLKNLCSLYLNGNKIKRELKDSLDKWLPNTRKFYNEKEIYADGRILSHGEIYKTKDYSDYNSIVSDTPYVYVLRLSNKEIINDLMKCLSGLRNVHSLVINGNYKEYMNSSGTDYSDTAIFQNFICKMKLLKEIELEYLSLKEIPDAIGQLTHLTKLDCKWNKLEKISSVIGSLEELEYLNFNDCKIKELPASICKLKNLKELDLNKTDISEFPENIDQLSGLEKLSLGNVILKEEEYKRIEKIFGDKIKWKPFIGYFPKGTILSDEQLDKTKEYGMYNVVQGSVSGVYRIGISACDGQIEKIKDFDQIQEMKLSCKNIQDEISRFELLQRLDLKLYYNYDEQPCEFEIPESFGRLVHLRQLKITGGKLESLGPVGKLNNLKSLTLNKNNISEFPVEILELKNLERLNLEGNSISDIPPELAQLKKLKILDVSKMKTKVNIPKELSDRKDLIIYK